MLLDFSQYCSFQPPPHPCACYISLTKMNNSGIMSNAF